ncbi:MAG: hypothetical protein OEV88_05630 [Gammaproteobacteria bacterium]|nr:hypothetical protein [Gammaproteobacteria bacterium]
MLSESSYLTALYFYIGAGLATMLYLCWVLRHWNTGLVALLVLLAGALLLTPAYPKDGVDTLAPALIVAVFQLITEGVEGARHALKPLAFTCTVAVVLALLLRLSVFRKRPRRPPPPAGKSPGKASGGAQPRPRAKTPARRPAKTAARA